MVNSINTSINIQKPQNSQSSTPPSKTTKTSIFYINDLHCNLPNMQRIKSASDSFDSFQSQDKTDKLKLASGDILLGRDKSLNTAAVNFQNAIGLDATALGNHEFDIPAATLSEITKDAKYKMLGFNTDTEKSFPLNDTIIKSYVQEKDGTQYGVIGLIPFDLMARVKDKDRFSGLNLENFDNTVKNMQAEIDKLQAKGVNKIIVLSHAGLSSDKKLASQLSGVDVILGGHSHDLIEGIKEGENLFYSKKGEPVIITQAGREGKHFGVLNLEFDDKGVIKKAQNNVTSSKEYKKNEPLKYVFDKLLGKPEVVGTIASAPPFPENPLIAENPHASFLADAMKTELKTDIAIVNSASLRGGFEEGEVDTRDLTGVTPFKNKMCVIKYSEKELVDALNFAGKSLNTSDNKPGILQVSGFKYIMTKKGELKKLSYLDKNGSEIVIDVKNPNPFKTYRVAIDDFYAKGGDNFTMFNKYSEAEEKYDFDKDKLAADYIKHLTKPAEIKPDGRIQIID